MPLKVNEIFKSIQGESTHAGRPCVFIRLTGCNIRCSYCDTKYAYEEGKEMEIEKILSSIKAFNSPLVEITGGEPLMQPDTLLLAESLLKEGYEVMVETNGTLSIDPLNSLRSLGKLHIILDLKTPSSEVSDSIHWDNLKNININDEIKFVLGDRADYEWAKSIINNYQLITKCLILFSPVSESLDPAILVEWILDDNLNVRLNLQIHKVLWGDKRGV